MFIRTALAASFVTAGLLAAGSATAAPASASAPAWAITQGKEPGVCLATGPADGATRLILVLHKETYLFMLAGPDMPKAEGEVPVSITFDGHATTQTPGLGIGDAALVFLGPAPSASTVLKSAGVRVDVDGRSHTFPLAGAVASLAALADCAGKPLESEGPTVPAETAPAAVPGQA